MNIFTPLRARRHHSYLLVFDASGVVVGAERWTPTQPEENR